MLVQEEGASMLGASAGFNCLVSFLPASGGCEVELALG